MNCGHARELLSARLDGALSAAEAESLREHLESCEACRIRAADFEAVVGTVRGIPAPELSGSLAAGVVARLPRRRRPAPIRWIVPLAAAACLLILASLVLIPPLAGERQEVASAPGDATVGESASGAPMADRQAGEDPPRPAAPERVEEDAMGPPATAEAPAAPPFGGRGAGGGSAAPEPGRAEPGKAEPGKAERRREAGAWEAKDPKEVAGGATVRTYRVRGAEPDSAAGVILAELRSRRSREKDAAGGDARVVQDRSGEVAGMILDLTPAEIEFVTCLLVERPGVRIDRVNGDANKLDESREKGVDKKPGNDGADADGAPAERVKVRLDFASR